MHPGTFRASLAVVLGIAWAQACTAPEQSCTPGAEGCGCAEGTMCVGDLECVSGLCQAADVTSTAPTTQPPVDTPTTSQDDPTTTDTAPSTATTGPDVLTTLPDPGASTTDPDPATSSSTSTTDDSTTRGDTGGSIGPSLVWYDIGEFGQAFDVDFTPDGNLAVVGSVERTKDDEDGWLGVLDTKGAPLWERLHDGSWGYEDRFHAVAVDGIGNITAAGQSTETEMNKNLIAYTWDSQGNQLNIHKYGHPANLDDYTYGVAVDAAGNPYVCAWRTSAPFMAQAWITRYNDFSGAYWNTFGGAGVTYDCEVSPEGYLTTAAVSGSTAAIQRWTLNGDILFDAEYKLEGSLGTHPRGVALDPDHGDAYVTGFSDLGGNVYSPFIGRWGSNGLSAWVTHPTPDGDFTVPEDLVIDKDGNLRVIGGTKIAGVSSLFILTYDTEGNELDRTLWTAPEGEIRPLGVATRGNVLFIVGATSLIDPQILLASFEI